MSNYSAIIPHELVRFSGFPISIVDQCLLRSRVSLLMKELFPVLHERDFK